MKVIYLLLVFFLAVALGVPAEDVKPQKEKPQRATPDLREKIKKKMGMKEGQVPPFGGKGKKPERPRKADARGGNGPPPGFDPLRKVPMPGDKPRPAGRAGGPKMDGQRRKGPGPDGRRNVGEKGDRKRPPRFEDGVPPKRGRDDKGPRRKRPPPGPKGEGKGGRRPGWGGAPGGRGKGPKGKLPDYDRFGPCQACYAVVGSLDVNFAPLEKEAKEAYNFEEHCMEKPKEYEIIQPPRKGSPLVQGPGLPDLKEKMGDEVKPADPKLTPRFMKDFHKVCSIATKDSAKVSRMFTMPQGALEDDKQRNKWKSGIRRNMCTRYCRRGKTEL